MTSSLHEWGMHKILKVVSYVYVDVYVDGFQHLDQLERNLFLHSVVENAVLWHGISFYAFSNGLQHVNRNNKKCHNCVFTSWMTFIYC